MLDTSYMGAFARCVMPLTSLLPLAKAVERESR